MPEFATRAPPLGLREAPAVHTGRVEIDDTRSTPSGQVPLSAVARSSLPTDDIDTEDLWATTRRSHRECAVRAASSRYAR